MRPYFTEISRKYSGVLPYGSRLQGASPYYYTTPAGGEGDGAGGARAAEGRYGAAGRAAGAAAARGAVPAGPGGAPDDRQGPPRGAEGFRVV